MNGHPTNLGEYPSVRELLLAEILHVASLAIGASVFGVFLLISILAEISAAFYGRLVLVLAF